MKNVILAETQCRIRVQTYLDLFTFKLGNFNRTYSYKNVITSCFMPNIQICS